MLNLVYYSSPSGMTKTFAEKVTYSPIRIPMHWDKDNPLIVLDPYLLICPTYCAGNNLNRATPPQVIKFLNIKENRDLCQGVIGTGQANYGPIKYCLGAKQVSEKLQVPLLYQYELLGLPEDVENVRRLLSGTQKSKDW